MSRLVFLDTETTGLDSDRCEVWEIGAIARDPGKPDVEYAWQIRPTLVDAEPTGLRIGRFYQRLDSELHDASPGMARRIVHPRVTADATLPIKRTTAAGIAAELAPILDGAHIVGAVPDFDARFLRRFLAANAHALTCHYHHLIDVEALLAGYLAGRHRANLAPPEVPLPWRSDDLAERCGVKPVADQDRHTALGDARWARDIYDAVMGGPR